MGYIESNSAFKYIPAVPVEFSGIWSTARQIHTLHLLIWHNLHSVKELILLTLI